MNAWSIRARLTVWFAAVLGAVLALITAATWFELRESFAEALDQSLADRASNIAQFLGQPGGPATFEETQEDLREYVALDPGWNLLQIADAGGAVLYCSPALEGQLPDVAPAQAAWPPRYADITIRGRPIRLATARVEVQGQPYTVQVAVPTTELEEALGRFRLAALLLIPAGMLAVAFGGYWISRRALGPVDRIAATARAITATALDRRLDVPPTGDELQRLSATLNEMLDRLQAAFEETRRFTADASHELRTPVALIRTAAEVALRRSRSADEYRSTLEAILREAERTSVLLQDLLTLARADAGVYSFERSRLDLGEIVAGRREALEALCTGHGLEFQLESGSAPPISGDRSALARVVLILVSNAVRYTPAPGLVRLTVGEAGGRAFVEVGDTGIGIAPEDLPRVFDRFFRADRARSRDEGGVGLGLSIAKWIVEEHGGEIRLDSEPAKGCRARVSLPAD